MKRQELGIAVVASSLLLSLHFPPYFISFLIPAVGGLAYLLKSLDEKDRHRLREFEREFRKGYEMEQKGKVLDAAQYYHLLLQRYPRFRYIVKARLDYLRRTNGVEVAGLRDEDLSSL